MSNTASRLLAVLLFFQAVFLASTFREFMPVLLVTLLAGVIVFIRRRSSDETIVDQPSSVARRVARGLGASCVLLGVLVITFTWRLGSHVGENINYVYVGSDILAHTCLFWALAVWAMCPKRGHLSMLPLGLITVLLCVAAGGASLSVAGQTTVALAACLGYAFASQVIMGAANGTDGSIFIRETPTSANAAWTESPIPSVGRKTAKRAWIGPLFSLLTLSLLLMATSAIAQGMSVFLPTIQEQLQEKLKDSLDPVRDQSYIGGTRYATGSKLGAIRNHLLTDPQVVALRVYANDPPGYLRGTVFDNYHDRRWTQRRRYGSSGGPRSASFRERDIGPSSRGRVTLKERTSSQLQRFTFDDKPAQRITEVEVHNDPMKGHIVFLPLTTRWLEAHSSELTVTQDGIVSTGVDVTKPYVAGAADRTTQEDLAEDRRAALLEIPTTVKPSAKMITDKLCPPSSTARTKASSISQFFQSEFTYSLNRTKVPKGVDPLVHFMETQHPAHCEFFASASVMLLRSAGVPARYVTGYVATELSEVDDCWLARHRDAHAWVEAYDDESKEWFPVESTPGRRYRSVMQGTINAQAESIFDVFGDDDNADDDTIFSRVLGKVLSLRATDPLIVVFRIAQLPLFCVLLFLLWSKYFKPSQFGDEVDQKSRRMLRQVDRQLRKHSLVRKPSETLYQFADRIDSHYGSDGSKSGLDQRESASHLLEKFSSWYRQYADARYQGKLPTPLV